MGKRSILRRSDPLTATLLVFPLFLVYQVGVLFVSGVHNGADLITTEMLHLLHNDGSTYLVVNLALAAGFVLLMAALRRKNQFDPRLFVPVVLESAIYAVTMGSLICFVMVDLLHIDPKLSIGPEQASFVSKLILSIGAGVHEELVFRLLMVGGGTWLLHHVLGLRRGFAVAIAMLVSAVLFSAAHHVIGGEPFRVGAFVYRILCGLMFAILFETRGFAVAVYTHALYDIYVLIVRG